MRHVNGAVTSKLDALARRSILHRFAVESVHLDAESQNDHPEHPVSLWAVGRLSIQRKKENLTRERLLLKRAQPSLLADPDETYWKSQFPKLFSRGSWIARDGEASLSLSPYMIVSHGTEADAARGWKAAFAVFWRDPQWNDTSCMRGQLFCHHRNAKIKPRWDLEPGKMSINPIQGINSLGGQDER
ncbi:MAG: DUF2599 domain-containing protein [Collinsella sp.]|nr:DUF2599 domain-containing protein [Collinsella sp.]